MDYECVNSPVKKFHHHSHVLKPNLPHSFIGYTSINIYFPFTISTKITPGFNIVRSKLKINKIMN